MSAVERAPVPLRRGYTGPQQLFRSPTTLRLQYSRPVEARRQQQSNMSKQMELAPLRRGHLILQQAQLKKEAESPQAASIRVGSAAGQPLHVRQSTRRCPNHNLACRSRTTPPMR